MFAQRCLNFAQLDTKPPHLDLIIAAPNERDSAIRPHAAMISRSIQAPFGI